MTTPKEVLQEQFNKVYTHLMTQKARSLSEDGYCRYRGGNGLTCAAGCMIPDDKYRPEMENLRWGAICRKYPEAREWLDIYLGNSLQEVHDNCSNPEDEWEHDLKWVAIRYGLTVPDMRVSN